MSINWTELFELQKKFDTRIIVEKGLEGTETIPWRTTALLVELAEFANEARWFKKWSNIQKPISFGKLVEEYVDAIHFIVGIGLELDFTTFELSDVEVRAAADKDPGTKDPDTLFQGVVRSVTLISAVYAMGHHDEARSEWVFAFILLRVMGCMFDITDEDIVAAYKAKNEENHARQDRGY